MSQRKKYLLNIEGQLKLVPVKLLHSLSLSEAVYIMLDLVDAQKEQFLHDAKFGDKLYYGIKIVDRLEETILKIEEKYPSIRSYINSHKQKVSN